MAFNLWSKCKEEATTSGSYSLAVCYRRFILHTTAAARLIAAPYHCPGIIYLSWCIWWVIKGHYQNRNNLIWWSTWLNSVCWHVLSNFRQMRMLSFCETAFSLGSERSTQWDDVPATTHRCTSWDYSFMQPFPYCTVSAGTLSTIPLCFPKGRSRVSPISVCICMNPNRPLKKRTHLKGLFVQAIVWGICPGVAENLSGCLVNLLTLALQKQK